MADPNELNALKEKIKALEQALEQANQVNQVLKAARPVKINKDIQRVVTQGKKILKQHGLKFNRVNRRHFDAFATRLYREYRNASTNGEDPHDYGDFDIAFMLVDYANFNEVIFQGFIKYLIKEWAKLSPEAQFNDADFVISASDPSDADDEDEDSPTGGMGLLSLANSGPSSTFTFGAKY
jgi:hypothetical protein